ncbi:MAG: hypothetical protein JNL38_02500 [Myxococcales bacterium]|nr:hypothetical protein [Myxococcales bacterium]
MDYTALDFESKYTPPAVPGASGVVESLFDFDRMLIETRRAEGSIVYGYDAFGRRAHGRGDGGSTRAAEDGEVTRSKTLGDGLWGMLRVRLRTGRAFFFARR